MLARIPDAVVLQMANEDVTDATLKHLSGMKSLRELDLAGSKIGDAGLAQLAGLVSLEKLILSRTQITDSGLKPLLDERTRRMQIRRVLASGFCFCLLPTVTQLCDATLGA